MSAHVLDFNRCTLNVFSLPNFGEPLDIRFTQVSKVSYSHRKFRRLDDLLSG
jgi:hypothetical protein